VCIEELRPRHSLAALWRGVDSVPLENVGDRRPTDAVADVPQSTLDSRITPPGILSSHPDRQLLDNLHDPASPWGAALVSPFLGNELPVPTKDGVGRDERCDFGESASANGFASHGESSALSVGQAEPSAAELLLQDAILLAEILDDRILSAANPAGHGCDEYLPRLKDGGHWPIMPTSRDIRQLSVSSETA
jgi:hypothetical protein